MLMNTWQQVTLSKEGTSGEVGLEAGALVLSDQVRVRIAHVFLLFFFFFSCLCARFLVVVVVVCCLFNLRSRERGRVFLRKATIHNYDCSKDKITQTWFITAELPHGSYPLSLATHNGTTQTK